MNFLPDLAQKVLAGEKTVTRRLASDNPRSPLSAADCQLVPGRRYAVCPGRGRHAIGSAQVASVVLGPLGQLDTAEARREGFDTVAAFEAAFTGINGGVYDPARMVWRVELENPVRRWPVGKLEDTPCPGCGMTGTLQIVQLMHAAPVGGFSLAGAALKFSARLRPDLMCVECPYQVTGVFDGRHAVFPPPKVAGHPDTDGGGTHVRP